MEHWRFPLPLARKGHSQLISPDKHVRARGGGGGLSHGAGGRGEEGGTGEYCGLHRTYTGADSGVLLSGIHVDESWLANFDSRQCGTGIGIHMQNVCGSVYLYM